MLLLFLVLFSISFFYFLLNICLVFLYCLLLNMFIMRLLSCLYKTHFLTGNLALSDANDNVDDDDDKKKVAQKDKRKNPTPENERMKEM